MNVFYNYRNLIYLSNIKIKNEKDYIKKCTEKEDFCNYISDSVDFNEYLLISDNKTNVGIFSYYIENMQDITTAIPSLYIEKKKTVSSVRAMEAVICFLFFEKKADRIKIPVFENNMEMNRILKRIGYAYEGTIPYANKINDFFWGINYYSMLKEEFRKICSLYW